MKRFATTTAIIVVLLSAFVLRWLDARSDRAETQFKIAQFAMQCGVGGSWAEREIVQFNAIKAARAYADRDGGLRFDEEAAEAFANEVILVVHGETITILPRE